LLSTLSDAFGQRVSLARNRSDIPPQIRINDKASERINLEAAVDTQGAWQTQLRLFLRF
jgi:translocation and assembly module TamB